MTETRRPAAAASAGLGYEVARTSRLLRAALSIALDRVFDLSGNGARRRRWQLLILVAMWIMAGTALHIMMYTRTGTPPAGETGTRALQLILVAWRMLLILGIAMSLALQATGAFVADIFDLKDARTAWRFVSRLGSGASPELLHLHGGKVADGDLSSASLQIGGPAIVVTDDETAAVFENPDGTPRVVSPDPGSARKRRIPIGVRLDGFERLREPVISLRDQYIGNPSGEPLTVIGRSLDGIPISVTDVRGVFSVRRDRTTADALSSNSEPYPVMARDILRLIYKQPVDVITNGEFASGVPGNWTTGMQTLIQDSLQEFMGQHRLAEFLSGVARHEAELSEFRADTILSKTLEVSSEAPELPPAKPGANAQFRPRTELSSKFRKHGSEFSTKAQEFGLELHWIGVGTWKMPDERSEQTVAAKHIEAWKLNRENASRMESDALESMAESALLERKLQIIQEVPLASHARNRERFSDKIVLMECLLEDFVNQLGDALDIYYRAGTPSAEVDALEMTVSRLERLLRVSQVGHVLAESSGSRVRSRQDWDRTLEGPPAPATRGEAVQYRALLTKLKGDFRVAEAMLANEKRRHGELSREQLIARIVERFERHGR